MVVLTYHRIPARADGSDFYAVDVNTLATHLDVLRSHGYEPGLFDDICAGTGRSFSLTFDDATIDHIDTAAPLLESNNIRGIFFIPTTKLGKPGRLTRAHIAGLSERGHEIGSHSHEHLRLDRMPQAEIRAQLETS
ncbi:MAG: polysaccharide deacetylase family protein, partial [Chthoniobacterales bacterium]